MSIKVKFVTFVATLLVVEGLVVPPDDAAVAGSEDFFTREEQPLTDAQGRSAAYSQYHDQTDYDQYQWQQPQGNNYDTDEDTWSQTQHGSRYDGVENQKRPLISSFGKMVYQEPSQAQERFPQASYTHGSKTYGHEDPPKFALRTHSRVPLLSRLPANATRIRPNIVDGFTCDGRPYGYYADPLNDCQIYHVCMPLHGIFANDNSVPDATYMYSFICNDFQAFDQQSLTCGYRSEVTPCEEAAGLYDVVNSRFFRVPSTPDNVIISVLP
ncbi:hypothetical protein HAZT_HAZT006919 [Hyalella azteca]|nr:hypothetical protein HAZT_HAZT006919 [Hyalella azteca]